jgi:hypothetical protein
MPNNKNHWTSPRPDGKWASKREGAERGRVFETQAEAWDHSKDQARKDGGEAYLKGRDNQIRERNTYGHDPRRTKG